MNTEKAKPKLVHDEALSIAKPGDFDINKFKSKRSASIAGVATLPSALPVLRISEARDWVRLHPDEDEYWSDELCFASVPVKGQDKVALLHLIDDDLAAEYLPSDRIERFRLALASKPWDVFFLCKVPTQNMENSWNSTNVMACLNAQDRWVMATSRKKENVDGYKVDFAKDTNAFPEPNWPVQSLDDLLKVTFAGRMIDHPDHPGLLRLIGAKQNMS